jgi:hypothetical protein
VQVPAVIDAQKASRRRSSIAPVMSSLVAQVPIIWMLYLEEVLVRMECDNELIQKSLSAENPLKRHLESPIFNKGDARIP